MTEHIDNKAPGNTMPESGNGQSRTSLEEVLALVAAMRDPVSGEPWARRQDMAGIVPYTIEESYEIAEAVDNHDLDAIRSELGDLLLQVVFYAQIGREQGWFDFNQVAAGLHSKLRQRYYSRMPGITERGQHTTVTTGELSGVSHAMPAVRRAEKLQKKASAAGFDWQDALQVAAKIGEELQELRAEIEADRIANARAELGDVMFVCINLARHLGSDAETILRHANRKFENRFRAMEEHLAAIGLSIGSATTQQLELAWQAIKKSADGG